MRGTRAGIQNRAPIVGVYGVNSEGSGDMYPKGGNMLHTIRQIIDDDDQWRSILRGLNRDYYHRTVDGTEIESYISRRSGKKLGRVFDQYLRSTSVPVLEYRFVKGGLEYRWTDCVEGFDMPVKVALSKGKFEFIHPTTEWQTLKRKRVKKKHFQVDENFYILALEK